MQLSYRLRRIADFVTDGCRLADIGTDHAYIPIELVQAGRIPSAIAMDIARGPLQRAKEHIQACGLLGKGSGRIEVRLSDGLKELNRDEADSVVIAGMGGALTVRILSDGADILDTVRELILSPHTEISLVRRYLIEHSYNIVREEMVRDMGKYYTIMRAVHISDDSAVRSYETDEYGYIYGRLLLEERSPVFLSYIREEKEKMQRILAQMEENKAPEEKRREVRERLNYLEGVM